MHHALKLGESEHNLELSRTREGYTLHLADRRIALRLQLDADGVGTLHIDGRSEHVVIATRGDDVFVHMDGEAYALHYEHPLERLAHTGHDAGDDLMRAPMPGSLVLIQACAGDAVARGQTLLVMESMKMETTIAAPRDGVVKEVHYAVAQAFERDAVLVTMEAQS